MKVIRCFILIIIIVTYAGCSSDKATRDTSNTQPTPIPTMNNKVEESDKIYHFDASKEWDNKDYEIKTGMEFHDFSAPIQTPYSYTYTSEDNTMTMDDIAYELGVMMMEDLEKEYEGKAFTVTEYRNLSAKVLEGDELADWIDRYTKAVCPVVIEENQWLCYYQCEYKYTGVFSGIGEMPEDIEWMDTLLPDGSGEDYAFIIQKINDKEYIMRALPKTFRELK